MALDVSNARNANSSGSFGDWGWDMSSSVDVTLSRFTFEARQPRTYTLALNVGGAGFVNVGSDATTVGSELCDITFGTPVTVPAGTTVRFKITPNTSCNVHFRSAPASLAGTGAAYTTWGGASFPNSAGASTSTHHGTLYFDEPAAAEVTLTGAIPALVGDFTLDVEGEALEATLAGQIPLPVGSFDLELGEPPYVPYGSWSWWTRPRAVAYDGKVYVGSASMDDPPVGIVVDEYDAGTLAHITRHLVSTDEAAFDDHNNPAIALRSGEPPLVIWSRHGSENVQRIVTGTQDIDDGFAVVTGSDVALDNGASQSYTVLHITPAGVIHAISRSGVQSWMVRTSTDWGATWAPKRILVSHTAQVYVASSLTSDGKILLAASAHPRESTGQSIYYAVYDPSDHSVRRADGTLIGTAGTGSAPAFLTGWPVVAAPSVTGYRTWVYDVTGTTISPEIVWGEMDQENMTPALTSYRYAKLVDGSWETNEIIGAGDGFGSEASADAGGSYLGGAQFAQPGTVLVTRELAGTWFVEYHTTSDDGATWDAVEVTSSAEHRLVRAWKVESVDGTSADCVAVNVITPPFESYSDHTSTIELYPAPSLAAGDLEVTLAGAIPLPVGDFSVLIEAPATATWWNGSSRQAATIVGWWDGESIQPLEQVDHWWDGSAPQDLT